MSSPLVSVATPFNPTILSRSTKYLLSAIDHSSPAIGGTAVTLEELPVMHFVAPTAQQGTLGLAALANCLHLLRSTRLVVLAPFQKAPAAVRTIIARVDRGFAEFAQVPYQDAHTRRELLALLYEFEADSHAEQSD
jgi:hypothetical protein